MPQPLDAMTEDQLLDHADDCAGSIQRTEVELLRVAYQWAIVHGPDRLDPQEADLPGRERTKRLGGDGVPLVCEFAAAGLGARMRRSPAAAASLMADALDLRHRLPCLWARVERYEVRLSYARHVARATRELTAEEAALVDAAVAESADGRISWSRFERLVEGQVAAAAPAAAKAKEEAAAKARFAKLLRATDPDQRHGMASFLIRADLATITQIDAVVTAVAATLRPALPDLSADDLRIRALMLLLHAEVDPDTDLDADAMTPAGEPASTPTETAVDLADLDLTTLMPVVQLYVHMYADHLGVGDDPRDPRDSGPIARVEGHGPVTRAWLRDVLGTQCRFAITPVVDLEGQAPVDGYEIPDRHRHAVHLISPADCFPYASNLDRRKQVDHTVPWDPGGPPGQSAIGNYGPMTTFHHRLKTHGHWRVAQPFPGIYLWRDPGGRFHLVDHTGTRPLPGTAKNPITIELYRSNSRLDYAPAA